MLIATAKKAVVAEAGGGALLWGFPQPEPSLVQELCHIYPLSREVGELYQSSRLPPTS